MTASQPNGTPCVISLLGESSWKVSSVVLETMSSGKDLLSLDWGRILSIGLSTALEPPNSATSSASARVPIGLLGAVGSDFDPWFNNQAQVAPLRPLLGKTRAALDSLFPPVSVPDVAKKKKKERKTRTRARLSTRVGGNVTRSIASEH